MRAAQYQEFSGPVSIVELPEPQPPEHGVVIEVAAAGMCRSDWHGWLGHDPDIRLPQVPGHEWSGTVLTVGAGVTRWRGGERVTAPFVCGCGACDLCAGGQHQVCPNQTQPGFTHDGAFAQRVVIHHADVNLVALPDGLAFDVAAGLGCRFATAYRAVRQRAQVEAGSRVAVFGCGGVGLSAVMIAAASGAHVVAVDIDQKALELAARLGAGVCVDSSGFEPDAAVVGGKVAEAAGPIDVALDALGSPVTAAASVYSLGRQGRHVQVGLLPAGGEQAPIPMDRVIGQELEIVGSHGMSATTYPAMLAEVADGSLHPELLITRHVGLGDVPGLFPEMSKAGMAGVTVIDI